ncbi:MAG: hypothetical protein Kow006_14310 [Gammaproteobacteria bacterium]
MGLTAKEVSVMVFRRVSSRGAEELASDPVALRVLRLLDGKRDLATVAREAELEFSQAIKVITQLCKMKLAESAGINPRSKKLVNADFMKELAAHYSLAVGPISQVMIEDTVTELGYTLEAIPESAVINLVYRLSEFIQEPDRRDAFEAAMQPWIEKSR